MNESRKARIVQKQNILIPATIGRVQTGERAAVLRLYHDCAYSGGMHPSDVVLVARAATDIVGAVRVCREQGTVVLRGMQVRAGWRGQGIGKRLLAAAIPHLDHAVCYCLPYSHLVDFYASGGFRVVGAGALPEFLRERLDGYVAEGQNLLAMRREPGRNVRFHTSTDGDIP